MSNDQKDKDQQFVRLPAKRVFARELREIRHTFKESDDEKAPTFALLPTGEKASRVLMAGTLLDKEKRGTDTPFYRMRIEDPTGTFFASAGTYQPEAMQQIMSISAPAFVMVVGKPNLYVTPEEKVFVSVTVTNIYVIDKATRNLWTFDAARATLERVNAFPDSEMAALAVEKYGEFKSGVWSEMVSHAISSI